LSKDEVAAPAVDKTDQRGQAASCILFIADAGHGAAEA
jgi:hypothetical protein